MSNVKRRGEERESERDEGAVPTDLDRGPGDAEPGFGGEGQRSEFADPPKVVDEETREEIARRNAERERERERDRPGG